MAHGGWKTRSVLDGSRGPGARPITSSACGTVVPNHARTHMTRRRLALIDGFFGVLIGAFSLAWASANSPITRRVAEQLQGFGSQVFAASSAVYVVLLGIPMFIDTAAFAPALNVVLRHWSVQSPLPCVL